MLEAYSVDKDFQNTGRTADDFVQLNFDERKKSRYLCETTKNQKLAWFLERGYVLQAGDVLTCENGTFVEVIAADEALTQVTSEDMHLLMRAAYHLGNRHVPLQVNARELRFHSDHVLEGMISQLGLTLKHVRLPFTPESGAYHSHGGDHSQEHSQYAHSHTHSSAESL